MELLTVIKCPAARGAAATAVNDPTHRLSVHVCMRVYACCNCPQCLDFFRVLLLSAISRQCHYIIPDYLLFVMM